MSINNHADRNHLRTRATPRLRVAQSDDSPSLTKQAEKQSCDINFIIQKYQRTGMLEHINRYQGVYGEAPAADFREALETVRTATSMFEALPSSVRKRFDNDPAAFLDFCSDPANLEEARLLGLADPRTTAADLSPPPVKPQEAETASGPKGGNG